MTYEEKRELRLEIRDDSKKVSIARKKTLEKLSSPYKKSSRITISIDDLKDILIARKILNETDLPDGVYTGEYKVDIDNDLPVGIIDVVKNE